MKALSSFRPLAISFLLFTGFKPNCGAVTNQTPVTYTYSGRTLAGDSSITAFFQFDAAAMSDRMVFFYEIDYHSFTILGSAVEMNGQYDRFLGGGMNFASSMPGPQNLPTFQSLIIQNSVTRYYVQSRFDGQPDIFLGGPSGTGYTYYGEWGFQPVPEPGSVILIIMGLSVCGLLQRRRLCWRTHRHLGVWEGNN